MHATPRLPAGKCSKIQEAQFRLRTKMKGFSAIQTKKVVFPRKKCIV